jgi:hypothetical protein
MSASPSSRPDRRAIEQAESLDRALRAAADGEIGYPWFTLVIGAQGVVMDPLPSWHTLPPDEKRDRYLDTANALWSTAVNMLEELADSLES